MSLENLSTRYDTNWAVQPLKLARGLKFRIYKVEVLYYVCSENSCVVIVQLICKSMISHDMGFVSPMPSEVEPVPEKLSQSE